ncbi:MAG TPA: hypothetical protein VGJ73_22520, partial [Verrucomicrobiae bacterium]
MNNTKIKKTLLLAIGGVFVWWAWKSPAQDATGVMASPQMPYAVTQVLELEQAKIGDSTIIAYVKSSGTSYNLNASQIVFLRQQGASDAVITAMLSQPRTSDPAINVPAPEAMPASAPQFAPVATSASTSAPAIVAQPPVTYVQSAPASDDYSYYYPSTYYASYGWPHFWFPWSYGWGWHGGAWV